MKVVWTEENDREVFKASKLAQQTLRHFWREVFWERRRIVPAYDSAVAKLAFIGPSKASKKEQAVEFMWIDEVVFDGRAIEGTLMNEPISLRGLERGDRVSLGVDQLADWMLVRDGKAVGAFTVNVMRRSMKPAERAEHDAAWGLDFGKPTARPNLKPFACAGEHPMARNVTRVFEQRLRSKELEANEVDEDGWTQLHHFALAGAVGIVRALLRHGADARRTTPEGLTPSQLAATLQWKTVSTLLRGAKPKRKTTDTRRARIAR